MHTHPSGAPEPRFPVPRPPAAPPRSHTAALRADYEAFVLGADHPCVMAQTIFRQGVANIHAYEALACPYSATRLSADLRAYAAAYDPTDPNFVTFLAAFPREPYRDEPTFERLLWGMLQQLNDADPEPWDARVSSDPTSDKFSFSVHGQAFYIVGLHPGASRMARRAPYATLVFNLHDQFERLRGMGAYTRVRNRIRRRDKRLQGSINPMLRDFGAGSEARQYAGRAVSADWVCPFAAKQGVAVRPEGLSLKRVTTPSSLAVGRAAPLPRRPSKGDRPQPLKTPGVRVDRAVERAALSHTR